MNIYFPKRITIVIALAIASMGVTLLFISYIGQSNSITPIRFMNFDSDQIFILKGQIIIYV
ncbi:MAG: hypothetical protein P8Y97_10830 [Candidatus Lokiarchaeota archaeon]